VEDTRFEELDQAIAPVLAVFSRALGTAFEVLAEFAHGSGKNVNAFILGGNGSNHLGMPSLSRRHQRQHGVKLLFQALGTFTVGFVEHEDVADFHEAGFHVLNVVAQTGNQDNQNAIGEADDIHFVLADAHGFNEYLMLAGGVENKGDFGRSSGQPAQKSARSHGADKDARIAGMALHADAIAENSAAAVRAGGIDSNDADAFCVPAIVGGETIDERAFAGAGRA